MSTDYSAATVIGYKVDISKFYKEIKKPNCGHNPKDLNFCPTCGTKAGFHTELHRVDEEEEFTDFLYSSLPKGYIHESPYDGGFFWIGYGNSIGNRTNDQGKKMEPKPIEEIKTEIANFLSPWTSKDFITLDESTFGIWTIMGIH